MKKLKVILIGAGSRGTAYTNIMAENPDKFQVIAVAEPIESRREYIREKHNILDDMCFESYEPLLALGKIADIAVIATMDRDHTAVSLGAIALGYDLLLEKPIAPTAEECRAITDAAVKKGVKVVICTVLRYSDIFVKIKEIIDSGRLGNIISINHEECVGNIHQSHSFVRGNWGNEHRSSTMLLQKSCHDLDILQWLIGKKCKKIQSFGALTYFKSENAPEGAPDYCIEGCPMADTCQFNAVKLYLEDKDNRWFRTTSAKEADPTDEQVRAAITNTQYGKCVFKCDNTVVDHQTVNMLFEGDATVTFTMNCFNKGGRHIHIMGTNGELDAALSSDEPIKLYDFIKKESEEIPMTGKDGVTGGHGGGDTGLVNALYDYLNGTYTGNSVPEIEESLYNHMLVFAAEKSRIEGGVVDIDEFIGQ